MQSWSVLISALARRACYSDSIKMTQAHHCHFVAVGLHFWWVRHHFVQKTHFVLIWLVIDLRLQTNASKWLYGSWDSPRPSRDTCLSRLKNDFDKSYLKACDSTNMTQHISVPNYLKKILCF